MVQDGQEPVLEVLELRLLDLEVWQFGAVHFGLYQRIVVLESMLVDLTIRTPCQLVLFIAIETLL